MWFTTIQELYDCAPLWECPGYSVYRIEFQDGAEYVGMTEQAVALRVEQHLEGGLMANEKVHQRHLAGVPFRVEVLATNLTRRQAQDTEDRAIRKLSKPLNGTRNARDWDDPHWPKVNRVVLKYLYKQGS